MNISSLSLLLLLLLSASTDLFAQRPPAPPRRTGDNTPHPDSREARMAKIDVALANQARASAIRVKGNYQKVRMAGPYMIKVERNGLYGLLNAKGEVRLPVEYKMIRIIEDEDFVIFLRKGNLYGVLDKLGKELLPVAYSNIMYLTGGKQLTVTKDRKKMILNDRFKEILPEWYDDVTLDKSTNRFVLSSQGLTGYANLDGSLIIAPIYKSIRDIGENLNIAVDKSGKYGVIDDALETIIPFEYDELYAWSDELAMAGKNGKYGFITVPGNEVKMDFLYDEFEFNKSVSSYGFVVRDGLYGLLDSNFVSVISPIYNRIRFTAHKSETFWAMNGENKWGLINTDGTIRIPFLYDNVQPNIFNTVVTTNDAYGIIDHAGKVIVPDGAYGRFLTVKKPGGIITYYVEGLYGVLDKSGKEIFPAEYKSIITGVRRKDGVAVATVITATRPDGEKVELLLPPDEQ